MKICPVVLTLILAGMSLACSKKNEVTQSGFKNRTFHYRYASGLEVTGKFAGDTDLEWEALTGPSKGQKGNETIHAVSIADNIFFISWLEKSGTSVSQVMDLNTGKVKVFLTFEAEHGRQSFADEGTLEEIKTSP